jgi:hypothetical protein
VVVTGHWSGPGAGPSRALRAAGPPMRTIDGKRTQQAGSVRWSVGQGGSGGPRPGPVGRVGAGRRGRRPAGRATAAVHAQLTPHAHALPARPPSARPARPLSLPRTLWRPAAAARVGLNLTPARASSGLAGAQREGSSWDPRRARTAGQRAGRPARPREPGGGRACVCTRPSSARQDHRRRAGLCAHSPSMRDSTPSGVPAMRRPCYHPDSGRASWLTRPSGVCRARHTSYARARRPSIRTTSTSGRERPQPAEVAPARSGRAGHSRLGYITGVIVSPCRKPAENRRHCQPHFR